MIGGDYSTKFSPWMALGCLSPRKIYHELKAYETSRVANKSTYWVVFEMIWRDFFRFFGYAPSPAPPSSPRGPGSDRPLAASQT